MGKCVPLKLIIILFYAHWETKGGLYQNLSINATAIPQLAYACDRPRYFFALHGWQRRQKRNATVNAFGAPIRPRHLVPTQQEVVT